MSHANESGYFTHENIIPPDDTFNDALKLSNCYDTTLTAATVYGGSEDVLDINRGANLYVYIKKAMPRGKYVATIKGGAENITIKIDCLIGHGKETDFDLGNWSDQEPLKRTKKVYLDITTSDGSPVKVRVLHAWKPILLNAEKQKYIINTYHKGYFRYVWAFLKFFLNIFAPKRG